MMGKVINVGTLGHVDHGKIRFVNPMLECNNIEAMFTGVVPKYESTREMLEADGYTVSVTEEGKVDVVIIKSMLRELGHRRIIIIDEARRMSPELFDKLCDIDPEPCQKVLLSSLYGESCRYIEPPDYKTMVKNENHSNEPWRRKQWKNR